MVRQPFDFAQGKAHHKLRIAEKEQGGGGAGERGRKRCRIANVEFRKRSRGEGEKRLEDWKEGGKKG